MHSGAGLAGTPWLAMARMRTAKQAARMWKMHEIMTEAARLWLAQPLGLQGRP